MPYLLALMIVTLSSGLTRISRIHVYGIALIASAFVIGTAKGSWDYDGYIDYFQCSVETGCFNEAWSQVETSFVWFAKSFHFFFGEYGGPLLIFVYSTIGVFLKLALLQRYSRHFGIAFLSYASFGILVHEMTQIRVGLAIAFLWLFLVSYYVNGRRARAFIYLSIAVFLHSSALLILLHFPFIRLIEKRPRTMVVALISASFLGIFLANSAALLSPLAGLIGGRFSVYFDAFGSELLATQQFNVYAVYSLMVFGLSVRMSTRTRLEPFEYACQSMIFVGLLIYMITFWIPIIGLRALELFASVIPFTTATLVRKFHHQLTKPLIYIITIVLALNMLVRNGIRTDFVLEGQAQETFILDR